MAYLEGRGGVLQEDLVSCVCGSSQDPRHWKSLEESLVKSRTNAAVLWDMGHTKGRPHREGKSKGRKPRI
jgi:hypothetical protein